MDIGHIIFEIIKTIFLFTLGWIVGERIRSVIPGNDRPWFKIVYPSVLILILIGMLTGFLH